MIYVVRFLFLLLPLPFILSQYIPLEEYSIILYFFKHAIVLSLFVLTILNKIKTISIIKKSGVVTSILFIFFLFYLFINVLLNSEIIMEYIFYIISIFIMLFVVLNLDIIENNFNKFKYSYYSLFVTLFLSVIYSIIFDVNLYNNWGLKNLTRIRWSFGFYHPGYLASYFLVMSITSYILISKKMINKYHYISIVFSIIIIYMTGTRNSMFALLLFLLIVNSRKTYNFIKFIFFTFIPILIILFISGNYDILNKYSSNRLETWTTHFIYNYNSFNYFFGTGLGNAKRIDFTRNFDVKAVDSKIFHVDNYFFEIFLQFGFIGIALMLLLFFSFYVQIKRIIFPKDYRIALALLVAIQFYGFYDSGLISTGNIVPILIWSLFFQQIASFKYNSKIDKKGYMCL